MSNLFKKSIKKSIDKQKKKLYNKTTIFGDMAQLVERLVRNEEASGSNPLISTKKGELSNSPFLFLYLVFIR